MYEECRIIVGYNDLFHTLGGSGQRVRLQTGEYWDFTCSRKLTGDANDNGVVNETSNEPDDYRKVVETDFNVDIMCCDPADDSCKQVCFQKISRTKLYFSVQLTQLLFSVLVLTPIRSLHFLSISTSIMMDMSIRMSTYTLTNVLIRSMMKMRLKWVSH